MIDDFDLVVSSFQTQYGIRLSRELSGMKWTEFSQLLSGLGPDTPLGRVVSIRSEDDQEILKHFSKAQHNIRNEWLRKKAKEISQVDMDKILESYKQMFINMAG